MTGPRYKVADGVTACEDCGVVVTITEAHTRFHSIMSSWAWALAILKTTHIGPAAHNRYDAVERIDSKRFDSWSGDALAEVIAAHEDFP
jgi:hypothetical protein